MKICLFYSIVHPKLDGTFTTILDTYFNLKKFNFSPILICPKNNFHYIFNYYRFFIDSSFIRNIKFLDNLNDLSKYKYDIIITTANVFRQNPDLKLNCTKLIILDTLELFYNHYYNVEERFINNIRLHTDNFKIFANGYYEQFNYPNYEEYYIKFSEERLNFIKNKSNDKNDILYTENNINTYDKCRSVQNIYTFKEYYYNRWVYIDNSIYFENIGKLIFEYIYLNKKVSYSIKNRKDNGDGLTHYLKMFDIDDNKDLILSNLINKEDIINKLFMNENDKLINEIK